MNSNSLWKENYSTNGTGQTRCLPGKKGLWSLPHSHSKIKVKTIRDLKKIKLYIFKET